MPELCEGGFPVGAKEECGRLRSPAWEDGIARSDIRVSEAKRGRVLCMNEGEYRLPSIEHQRKEKYLYLKPSKIFFRGNAKIPPIPKNQRDFL